MVKHAAKIKSETCKWLMKKLPFVTIVGGAAGELGMCSVEMATL